MLGTIIKAIIVGIVEGITEWLPVSSTGHMILLEEFLDLGVSAEFMEMFRVVIQLGAVLSVAVLFFKRLFPWRHGNTAEDRRRIYALWGRIFVSCVPAAVVGILLDDKIDALFYNPATVAAALFVYGVLFIVIERKNKTSGAHTLLIRETSGITLRTAAFIGLFQLLSLIPGTSRSGATIIGAMLFGATRAVAAEYTFFLALPVMAGASGIKLLKFGFGFSGTELAVLAAGFVTAFAVSVVAIRFLTAFVKKHTFTGFGWYRIALAAAVAAWFLL